VIVERLLLSQVLGWSVLAAALVGGLAGLSFTVEAARLGPMQALLIGASTIPAVLVMLSPTLAAVGGAAAAARMEALGERLTLDAAGFHPARAVAVAVLAGALLGVGQQVLSDQVVWRAAALRPSEAPGWIWLDDGALRPSDGIWVGWDLSITVDRSVPPGVLQAAQMRQHPQTASGAALRQTDLASARLEQHSRVARSLACAALAGIAWLPGRSGGLGRAGMLLAFALAWQAADAIAYAAAAQGQLSPAVGAWAAAVAAAAVLGAGTLRLR
jgi:lipopolysaccharide export LptBFGC system permease protein LptF